MKIAVFDYIGNFGGGSRFIRALLPALKQNHPLDEIIYFGNRASMAREKMDEEFLESGIMIKYLSTTSPLESGFKGTFRRAAVKRIKKYLPPLIDLLEIGQVHREIERAAKGFDLAFFPWPYLMECPDLNCPMVGVFHDFLFKYNFGAPVYNNEQLDEINRQTQSWLKKVTPVVSSKFIGNEIAKFYPSAANKVRIVHMAPFSISAMSDEEAITIVRNLGIKRPYIIYPTNLCSHKNVTTLIHAMYLVSKRNKEVKLIFTGPGTESLNGSVQQYGVETGTSKKNAIGLGYVTNNQIDALIQCATAVVSTSLYEAGNGPGLEAWSKGVPVLMSDIPSFVEHLDVLGVKATLFDPANPAEIAQKINSVISDNAIARKDAEYSRVKIQAMTWKTVADNYYNIFSDLVSARR